MLGAVQAHRCLKQGGMNSKVTETEYESSHLQHFQEIPVEDDSDCSRLTHLLEAAISLCEAPSKLAYLWITKQGQSLSLSI